MAGFPPISVRQPRPHDIVDDPVGVCGIGTGFEGVLSARVRDANGTELKRVSIHAGGTGISGATSNPRSTRPERRPRRGTLAISSAGADGSGRELNKVVVPIIFGKALISPYNGFAQYTVGVWRHSFEHS